MRIQHIVPARLEVRGREPRHAVVNVGYVSAIWKRQLAAERC